VPRSYSERVLSICVRFSVVRKPICVPSYRERIISERIQIQRSWVRFPALPDFLRGSGSGTGSTQPREYS
jgi:hypothetical protein